MNTDTINALSEKVLAHLPAVGSGLGVILGFWIASAAARSVVRRVAGRLGPESAILVDLAGNVAYWTLLVIGIISGLGTMGIDVGALVAGLGLTGFALGFALRDAVSNLLAGVLILVFRPFRYGDHIEIAGREGRVLNVDLRYTTVQGDGQKYLIPNQIMYKSTVTVFESGDGETTGED